jgi:hypothetical protein
MRRAGVIAAASMCAALAVGCGSGGDDESSADAFIECFSAPSYMAVRPQEGQESLFAKEAERKGFPNTPVNIVRTQDDTTRVFLVFFQNEDQAKAALNEIGRETESDIPPQQRGRTVLAYAFEDDKANTEKAVSACL